MQTHRQNIPGNVYHRSLPLCQHTFDFIDGHSELSCNVIRSSEETHRDLNLSHSSSDTIISEIETQTSTTTPVKSKEIETQAKTPSQVKSPDIEINNKCTSVIQEPDYVQNVKRANLNDIIEPWHGISNNVVCATGKASDQPAYRRSLTRAFVSRLNIL